MNNKALKVESDEFIKKEKQYTYTKLKKGFIYTIQYITYIYIYIYLIKQ